MKKILKNKKGFTLVELIVVIAILGVLAVVMVPAFTGYIQKASNANVQSSAKSYCTAYQTAYADYKAGNVVSIEKGLEALGAVKPADTDMKTAKVTIIENASSGSCTVSKTN